MRGRPISYQPGDFVVLLVGDSQVEAGTLPREQMPERLLERELRERHGIANAKVFSVASAGWGTDQELINLRRYFGQHRADLVLLWFTAVNDFWENGFLDRSIEAKAGHFKPTFSLAEGAALKTVQVVPTTKLGLLVEQSRAKLAGLTHADWRVRRWQRGLPAASAAQAQTPPECPTRTVEHAKMWDYADVANATVETHEAIAINRSHFSPFGKNPSPRERYQIRLTQALLGAVAAEAAANRAQFRFFYPYRHDLDGVLARVSCARTSAAADSPQFVMGIDGNKLIRALDTPALSPHRISYWLPNTPEISIGKGDIHHNLLGNQLVVKGLADQLAQQRLLPGTAR